MLVFQSAPRLTKPNKHTANLSHRVCAVFRLPDNQAWVKPTLVLVPSPCLVAELRLLFGDAYGVDDGDAGEAPLTIASYDTVGM